MGCAPRHVWVESISADGAISEHKIPSGSSVAAVSPGPDGNLYYVGLTVVKGNLDGNNRLGRVTSAGQIAEFSVDTQGRDTFNLVVGTDKTLWLAASVQPIEAGTSSITRITLPQ
jgi:hypothetical protein